MGAGDEYARTDTRDLSQMVADDRARRRDEIERERVALPAVGDENAEGQLATVMVNGKPCASSAVHVVGDHCVSGYPHYDFEGMVCANDGEWNEAYCSYAVGDSACAYCTDKGITDGAQFAARAYSALLDTSGGSAISYCNESPTPLVINSLSIPNKIKPKSTVTLKLDFTLEKEVSGGHIEVDAKFGLIPLGTHDLDLCDTIQEVGLSCPLAPRSYNVEKKLALPAIPMGTLTAGITATDQDGQLLLCMDATIKVRYF